MQTFNAADTVNCPNGTCFISLLISNYKERANISSWVCYWKDKLGVLDDVNSAKLGPWLEEGAVPPSSYHSQYLNLLQRTQFGWIHIFPHTV